MTLELQYLLISYSSTVSIILYIDYSILFGAMK